MIQGPIGGIVLVYYLASFIIFILLNWIIGSSKKKKGEDGTIAYKKAFRISATVYALLALTPLVFFLCVLSFYFVRRLVTGQ